MTKPRVDIKDCHSRSQVYVLKRARSEEVWERMGLVTSVTEPQVAQAQLAGGYTENKIEPEGRGRGSQSPTHRRRDYFGPSQ